MQTVQHAGEQVGGNLRAHNDGGRTDAQGEEEGNSDMWGLWKGDGGGVTRLPPHDSTRKGKGEEMGVDGRGHGRGRRGRAAKYRMEFPKGGTTKCPVEGCPGRAGMRTAIHVHLWRRHVRDTIIILEEGNLPHPRCENCDMFVPWRALNGRHKSTMMCKSGVERKRRRLAEAEIR